MRADGKADGASCVLAQVVIEARVMEPIKFRTCKWSRTLVVVRENP